MNFTLLICAYVGIVIIVIIIIIIIIIINGVLPAIPVLLKVTQL